MLRASFNMTAPSMPQPATANQKETHTTFHVCFRSPHEQSMNLRMTKICTQLLPQSFVKLFDSHFFVEQVARKNARKLWKTDLSHEHSSVFPCGTSFCNPIAQRTFQVPTKTSAAKRCCILIFTVFCHTNKNLFPANFSRAEGQGAKTCW